MRSTQAQMKILTVLCFAAIQSLLGCQARHEGVSSKPMGEDGLDGVGIANPAATYCIEHGGKLENYSSSKGDGGFCRFDSALIEEWTLYNAKHSDGGALKDAVRAYLNPGNTDINIGNGGANPASLYCASMGGNTVIYTSQRGESGMCEFPDRSTIEEWTLYTGPNASRNAKLTELLKQ